MAHSRSTLVPLSIALLLGLGACTDGGPSASEALQTNADEKFEKEEYKPKKKVPPPEDLMPAPTEAELKAWDRKDPEGEKHLYKWDKRNIKKMHAYWKDLQCFRDKMVEEGNKAKGSEPGSPEDERWYQFKQGFIPHINAWQQRLFANETRILEKSKFISNILEAHELVMNGYPAAFNDGDETSLRKAEAHWIIVNDKVLKYSDQLGNPLKAPDLTKPKEAKAWEKHCSDAMKPPKKDIKKVKKKTSI